MEMLMKDKPCKQLLQDFHTHGLNGNNAKKEKNS